MSMPINLWFDDIEMVDEIVTVRDGKGKLIEQSWKIPKPSGNPVEPASHCDRIINSYRKGSSTFSLVQAGSGKDVRFAVVPQSSIGSPTQKV